VARCEAITTIPKRLIDPTPLGGPLSADRLREMAAAVLRAIGIAVMG
jgi:hypothetical protein